MSGILSGNDKPIMMLYSDGGPDHRVNYVSVQLSLIAPWKMHDLDALIAVRTPPPPPQAQLEESCGKDNVATRAETNTPSDEYDSYREYRVANTNMYSRIHFFSEAINFIRQCSKFHTVIMLSNFINLIKTIIEMNEFTIFYQQQL